MPQSQPLSALEQRDEYLRRHIGAAPEELAAMLATIGAPSLDALIEATVPASIRLPAPLPLADAQTEAEALAASAPEADDTATLPPPATEPSGQTPADAGKKKARGKRKPLPIELPRIDVIHDVPEAERTCACGTPMVEIGQDVRAR